MEAEVRYGVIFGNGDGTEWFDAEVELTPEEESIYNYARKFAIPFDEVKGLEAALQRAYKEIESQEIDNALDMEDEYAMECTGRCPVDADELTELVHNRDAHTLAFLELEGLDDEELDGWDALDLDELPEVCDFVERFEPTSPFDSGWTLEVKFYDSHADDWEEVTEEEATEALTELFQKSDGDYESVEAYIERIEEAYGCEVDLDELAERIAENLGYSEYTCSDDEEY